MKKFAALLLAAVMTTSLAACGSGDNNNDSDRDSGSRSGGLSSILGGSDSEDKPSSGGIESSSNESESSNGGSFGNANSDNSVYPDADGTVGDTIHTAWFDFTINEVYAYDNEYAGYVTAPIYRLLVVDITISNTFNSAVPMFDDDFMISWKDGAAYPVLAAERLSNEFLPHKYDLNLGGEERGNILFMVPADCTDFIVSFTEIYEDNRKGDTFDVFFQVEASAYAGDYSDPAVGGLNNTMGTQWFDFTVESAGLYSEYDGITPTNGKQFLVLETSLASNCYDDVPMFDNDFQMEWDDDAPDAYEFPVTVYVDGEEPLIDDDYKYYFLPDDGEVVSVLMIYEVPVGYSEFYMCYEEIDEEGTVGSLYIVDLFPEQQ